MPIQLSQPARHAVYSANLVMLLVAIGRPFTTDDLFPDADDKIDEWRCLTLFWKSQFRADAWSRLVGILGVERNWSGDHRVLALSRDRGWPRADAPASDLYWTRDVLTADKNDPEFVRGHFSWLQSNDRLRQWQTNLSCDPLDDLAHHALEPLATAIEDAVTMVHGFWDERAISAAQSLITLWLRVSVDCDLEELLDAFQIAIEIARRGFPPTGVDARRTYRIIVLRTFRDQRGRLGPTHTAALRRQLETGAGEPDEPDELITLVGEILGPPDPSDPRYVPQPRPENV